MSRSRFRPDAIHDKFPEAIWQVIFPAKKFSSRDSHEQAIRNQPGECPEEKCREFRSNRFRRHALSELTRFGSEPGM